MTAGDEERRRVVRDLHDGAQQGLVHTVLALQLASRAFEVGQDGAAALLTEALEHAQRANEELRELSHGFLPAELTRGGLRGGVESLVSRMTLPVVTHVSVDRLPAVVEATAYFVVAEALTNVVKHARAGRAAVSVGVENGILHIAVRDDGVGGARREGSGLLGLRDRLEALDGRLRIDSPTGAAPSSRPRSRWAASALTGKPDTQCRACHTPDRRFNGDHWRIAISILVVDDDPTFRRLARLLLAAHGLDVVAEADSVSDALSTAQRVKPTAALVDVELPDGDGFALARELTAMAWSPRVVVTSVQSGRHFPAEAERNGAEAFVLKADLPTAPLAAWLAAG